MPDDQTQFLLPPPAEAALVAAPVAAYVPSLVRPAGPVTASVKREKFIGFVRDEENATLLHELLSGHIPNNNQVHLVDFRHALTILAAMTTPEIVLIDLSGEDQPINALMELADVVEPGTVVLAVGENHTVNFYRTVVKGMGIREYLPKPLDRAAVEKSFLPVISDLTRDEALTRGGRMVAVCGTRGGVGTSAVAENLAWYVARVMHRHTVLLDSEISTGSVALDLNVTTSHALSAVLEAPDRVDQLLLERCVHDMGERLHVMAGLEPLTDPLAITPEGAAKFVQVLRARYNYVVADAGARLKPLSRELLFNAQNRVIVMDPTMISIRNLERLLTLPGGSSQSTRAVLVLNKAGIPGGLAQSYMEQRLGLRFDAVIPDVPRIAGRAMAMGQVAASLRGPFRNGIAALVKALGVNGTGAEAAAD